MKKERVYNYVLLAILVLSIIYIGSYVVVKQEDIQRGVFYASPTPSVNPTEEPVNQCPYCVSETTESNYHRHFPLFWWHPVCQSHKIGERYIWQFYFDIKRAIQECNIRVDGIEDDYERQRACEQNNNIPRNSYFNCFKYICQCSNTPDTYNPPNSP